MKVRNRSGDDVEVHFDAIQARLRELADSLDGGSQLDIGRIVHMTIKGMHDGITTSQLDGLSARFCASQLTVHPSYDDLAGLIVASDMHKNLRAMMRAEGSSTLSDAARYSERVAHAARVLPGMHNPGFVAFVADHAAGLDGLVDYSRDFTLNYFALKTMECSYLLRDARKRLLETPQDMLMRVSIALHMRTSPPPGVRDAPGGSPVPPQVTACYGLLSRGCASHATPTLFNAGMRTEQYASCFLLGTDDCLASIFKTVSDCAQISKWAGGIGVHVSNVRGKGSRILGTNGESDGIVPMLKVFNETARYCNQSGRRKGSIAVYLEPWHADVWEFVELRKNTGAETQRARDLFLALWVPDAFMRAVEGDHDWYLMSPDVSPGLVDAVGPDFDRLYAEHVAAGRYTEKVRAKALWQHILACQLETGTPYMMFKDHVNRKSNQSNMGTIRSSNLCAEVTEYSDANTYAVCTLGSIAVNRFYDDATGTYDFAALHAVAKQLTRNLDKIIDINEYPAAEARASNVHARPIGVGVQGLGDLYCMMKLPYDEEPALQLDADLMETIYHGCLEASAELAEEAGAPYPGFHGSPFSRGQLQFDLWDAATSTTSTSTSATSSATSTSSAGPVRLNCPWLGEGGDPEACWATLKARIVTSGTRNSLLTALMPTATTSQLMGNSECFEPFHSNLYKRTTLAGEHMVVNRHLVRDLRSRGLWNEEVRQQLHRDDGSVQRIDSVPDDIKRVYRTVWEVSQRSIIDHALRRGPFVDQSQSMNLYFATPNAKKLGAALMYGWSKGTKTGCYYVRGKSAAEAIKQGTGSSTPSHGSSANRDTVSSPSPSPTPSIALSALSTLSLSALSLSPSASAAPACRLRAGNGVEDGGCDACGA